MKKLLLLAIALLRAWKRYPPLRAALTRTDKVAAVPFAPTFRAVQRRLTPTPIAATVIWKKEN
jgi:hypothetical protein